MKKANKKGGKPAGKPANAAKKVPAKKAAAKKAPAKAAKPAKKAAKPAKPAKAAKPAKPAAKPAKAAKPAAPAVSADAKKGLATGYSWISPYLTVTDPAASLAFYAKAFGFKPTVEMKDPSGKIMHAEMTYEGAVIYLGPENDQWGAKGPKKLGGTPVTVTVYTKNLDKWFARATEAGAQVGMPPADQFWGDRTAQVVDADGHKWYGMQHLKDVSPADMAAAMAKAPVCDDAAGAPKADAEHHHAHEHGAGDKHAHAHEHEHGADKHEHGHEHGHEGHDHSHEGSHGHEHDHGHDHSHDAHDSHEGHGHAEGEHKPEGGTPS